MSPKLSRLLPSSSPVMKGVISEMLKPSMSTSTSGMRRATSISMQRSSLRLLTSARTRLRGPIKRFFWRRYTATNRVGSSHSTTRWAQAAPSRTVSRGFASTSSGSFQTSLALHGCRRGRRFSSRRRGCMSCGETFRRWSWVSVGKTQSTWISPPRSSHGIRSGRRIWSPKKSPSDDLSDERRRCPCPKTAQYPTLEMRRWASKAKKTNRWGSNSPSSPTMWDISSSQSVSRRRGNLLILLTAPSCVSPTRTTVRRCAASLSTGHTPRVVRSFSACLHVTALHGSSPPCVVLAPVALSQTFAQIWPRCWRLSTSRGLKRDASESPSSRRRASLNVSMPTSRSSSEGTRTRQRL
mmetsp:Transcript_11466/g.26675  ORF Transcript_11466/g.26675 Transcript_11466/m.26675 type:complete len:353 (-) Transcript_11466:328-1386(-)